MFGFILTSSKSFADSPPLTQLGVPPKQPYQPGWHERNRIESAEPVAGIDPQNTFAP